MQLICRIYRKGPSEILPDSPSHQEKVVLTTPRDLQIFSFFQFIIRIALHVLVATLLIQSLCIKQIAHRAGACLVIIGIQAEILGRLLNGQTGNLHLLVCLVHPVPGILHADNQQLSLVGQPGFPCSSPEAFLS